jgi:hypothetical protein
MNIFRCWIKLSLAIAVSLNASGASSEILQGINYWATLGEVKATYPNAKFEPVMAAWVTKDQAFIKITGRGLPGTIYIAFEDTRQQWVGFDESKASSLLEKMGKIPTRENIESAIKVADQLSKLNENEGLRVEWVRWIPDSSISKERVEGRYGKSKCEFNDDFQPICTWKSRALTSRMSDDGKQVLFFETTFTPEEKEKGLER